MGIMLVYIAPDPSVPRECAPLPTDVTVQRGNRPGRRATPLVQVPINGPRRGGGIGPISRPPGRPVFLGRSPIESRDFYFEPANAVVPQGASVLWRFWGDTLHTVTLANGPQGFASPNLSDGRVFRHRFTKPGTYRLYCSLHPVEMTSTVRVLPRGRRR